MSLQSNIDRLFWRFQNGTFKPNQKDLDALISLCEWINRQKEIQRDNTLLSKLYILLFRYEIQRYEDISFAQYAINCKLDKPIEQLILDFQERLNLMEFEKFCKIKNIELDITKYSTTDELKVIQENEEDYLKLVQGKWEYEKVEKALYNQITEVINNYKNNL